MADIHDLESQLRAVIAELDKISDAHEGVVFVLLTATNLSLDETGFSADYVAAMTPLSKKELLAMLHLAIQFTENLNDDFSLSPKH